MAGLAESKHKVQQGASAFARIAGAARCREILWLRGATELYGDDVVNGAARPSAIRAWVNNQMWRDGVRPGPARNALAPLAVVVVPLGSLFGALISRPTSVDFALVFGVFLLNAACVLPLCAPVVGVALFRRQAAVVNVCSHLFFKLRASSKVVSEAFAAHAQRLGNLAVATKLGHQRYKLGVGRVVCRISPRHLPQLYRGIGDSHG